MPYPQETPIRFAILLNALLLPVFGLFAAAGGVRADRPTLFLERSVVASHKNGQKHAYPSMSRLEDGRLMLAWSASHKSGKDSHIVTALSEDSGKSWSKPVTRIKTADGRDYDPSILVSGKRIFVSSTTLPPGGKIATSTTWCTRSEDGGKTWSPLYKIPMNRRYTCGKTHQGLRLKSGTLLLGYSWDMFCETGKGLTSEGQMHLRAGVMISTDDGRTWQNGGDTDATVKKVHKGAVDGTDEPAIVELDDGSIYMLARTGSTHLYESRSTDEGRTWTTASPSPLFGCNAPAALCPFEADGRRGIMCVWNNAIARHPLSAAASFDGGKTWSKPKSVSGPTGGPQASYPSCTQAADGTLVAVWQQDTPGGRDIRSARFNLAWLLYDPLAELQKELTEVAFPAIKTNAPASGYHGGDPLKSKPVWKIHGDGGKTAEKGAIRLEEGGGYHIDNRPGDWDGDKSKLVECRMRVIDRDKTTGAHSAVEIWIGGGSPESGCQLFFREDAVAFDPSYRPCHRLDATKPHTYKILTDIKAGKAYLFVDDRKTPVLVTYLGSPEGFNINRILFGDSSGSSATVHGRSEWEFIRWRSVPEAPMEIKKIDKKDKKAASWTGKGPVRMIVKIPPRDLGGRKSDIMPARLKVDLAEVLAQAGLTGTGAKGKPDLSRIQVVRLDPKTGRPQPCKGFRGIGPDDRPYRFDDFDRRAYSFWYNVRGNGHDGQLVWEHLQEGNRPTTYAIYVDVVESDAAGGVSPMPTLGDSDALWTDRSDGFLITALQCKPTVCDWNGDGTMDILAGETQGHVFLFENKGTPQKPEFGEGQFITVDGENLRLTHYTAPCAADWDGDGDSDLIIGRANNGQIHFYENIGTKTKPVLADRGHVQADGSRIAIPHELTPGENKVLHQEYGCRPEVVDYDGDGDIDLLVGGYVSGAVFLFENTRGGKGIPQLTARGPIDTDGKTLRVGSGASPCTGDFDGDGDLDMISAVGDVVMGRFDPLGITYFENTGTSTKSKYQRRPFPFDRPHNLGIVVTPSAADIDADGDLDLVIGNYIRIWFYENVGTPSRPRFARKKPLAHRWGPVETGGFATAPCDWNGDGRIDLISSDNGRFELKLNTDTRNPPRWKKAGMLEAGGKEIKYVFEIGDPETFPVVADLDRDGRLDLIQGTAAGYVWFYKNIGTRTEPKLAKGVRLQTTDKSINGGFVKVGYYKSGDKATDFSTHSGDRSDPNPADFDGDGDLDLMVSDAHGFVTYFENVGGNDKLLFAPGKKVIDKKGPRVLIGLVDWNSDGRIDVIADKNVYLNVGKGKRQEFRAALSIPTVYIPYPHPYVIDWNRDGDEDILFSSSYRTAYLVERSYVEHGYAEARFDRVERTGE